MTRSGKKLAFLLPLSLLASVLLMTMALGSRASAGRRINQVEFEEARLFIEFNSSGNDLGFHVFLDGEDWRSLRIISPNRRTIFDVQGKGGYRRLGMTELFFEGAEPNLDDVPLEELLALFPEGDYQLVGKTVDGERIVGTATLTHAVPGAPEVTARLGANNSLVISWDPVTGPADILPDEEVEITGYQVIVGSFQVTVPASVTSVTVSPEFVGTLDSGEHDFEVLAIEEGGNQTITEGSFTLP
jgi:hypothetical protein